MVKAICFKCGDEKLGPFLVCEQCGVAPRNPAEHAISLTLCEHLSTEQELVHFKREIKNGHRPVIPGPRLSQARQALRDPQLMMLLSPDPHANQYPAQPVAPEAHKTPQVSAQTQDVASAPAHKQPRKTKEMDLHRNAFWVLGATTRDDRRRIVELAEEKSLDIDHEISQKARSDITSTRTRLAVEMAWLPGVSPKKAEHLARQVLRDPLSVRSESGLPLLAHANLMAAAFETVDVEDSVEDIAKFIQEMAYLVDKISIDDVLRDINEDRAVSGFPEIRLRDHITSQLAERKRHYRDVIKEALNRLPSKSLVETMTIAVNCVTASGEQHAPELIDELVDRYEVEVQEFIQKEAENIQKLIKTVHDCATSGEEAVKPLIDKLESVVRNWDKVAQPIQLSAKARGIQHQSSHEVAFSIRSLAIDLFNEHNMLQQSQRITGLLRELFSELPELAERVEQDVDALEDIFHNRKHAETRRKEWEREITYQTEIGLLFKDVLSISPDGVAWKGRHYPLESITRVRWGGISQSVNGIPTGTTYTIGFGDNHSEAVVELKRKEIYSIFLDKLWRAVCARLLTELLVTLKAGQEIPFGDARIRDDGVTLTKYKFLGAEQVQCTWYQVRVWSENGSFYIGAKDDKKAYVALSYNNIPNVHILEQVIHMAFKKPGIHGLSDLLRDD